MDFVAIDFETATGYRNSACAVAIITVKSGNVIDEYETLIQPPGNEYWRRNIAVHRIQAKDTQGAPTFDQVFPEIQSRLIYQTVVAHNAQFDRGVLSKTMEHYGIAADCLRKADWQCTC